LNNVFNGIIIRNEITRIKAIFFPFQPAKILINTITMVHTTSLPYIDIQIIKSSVREEPELLIIDEIVASTLMIEAFWYPSLGESTIPIIMNTEMQIIAMSMYFNTTS
jgi:hypothetical protein